MQHPSNRDNIEALKAALSITAVAEALGLEPMRGKFRCLHPTRHSHGDRSPSVSLSEDRGLFRCWVCQDVRGDCIELVSQVRNCSFIDALRWLRDTFPNARTAANLGTPSTTAPKQPTAIVQDVRKDSTSELATLTVHNVERPEHWREKLVLTFLKLLMPIDQADPHGNFLARDYLIKRKIFQRTWNGLRLRWVDDYHRVNEALRHDADPDLLREVGLVNDQGNLRFYKHRLILPYLDAENHPLHFQARAIDFETTPKELSLRGHIPCPYNVKELDQRPGVVYLCEGPIDTLTLVEKGFAAVGVPGVAHMKKEWIPLFTNKRVIVCFDNDEAGRTASAKIVEEFTAQGIDAKPLTSLPSFTDINDWFTR